MKKHEERCTLNPNRTCGMCKLIEETQPDLVPALELLPEPSDFTTVRSDSDGCGEWVSYDGLGEAANLVMPQLRDMLNNCPACILAALRQGGIPVPCVDGFNYKSESKDFFDGVNQSQMTW